MTTRSRAQAYWLFVLISIALLLSCTGSSGGPRIEYRQAGLSMNLPPGWRSQGMNPPMFVDPQYPEDNFGMIEDYPLDGKTLDEYLDEQVGNMKTGARPEPTEEDNEGLKGAFAGLLDDRLLSRTPTEVSGFEAVELVTEANYTVVEVDIKKGDRLIRVSLRAHRELYPQYETAFRKSLDSIHIKQ